MGCRPRFGDSHGAGIFQNMTSANKLQKRLSLRRLFGPAAQNGKSCGSEYSEVVEYVLHSYDSRYEDIIEISQIFRCAFVLGRRRGPWPRGKNLPLTCGSSTLLNTINRGRHSTLKALQIAPILFRIEKFSS